MQITIKKVLASDLTELQKLGWETFYESFGPANTEENILVYLNQNFNLEKINSELNNPYSAFYFTKLGEKTIGYFKLNFKTAQTDFKEDKGVEIERIYVIKQFQGNNVGERMCKHALDIARKFNAAYLWLGVWEKNTRAIQFYERNGFLEFGTHSFFLGNEEQTDVLMRQNL